MYFLNFIGYEVKMLVAKQNYSLEKFPFVTFIN